MATVDVTVEQGTQQATLADAFTYASALQLYVGVGETIEIRDPDDLSVLLSVNFGSFNSATALAFTDGFLYAIIASDLKKLDPDDLTEVATKSGFQPRPLFVDSAGFIYAQDSNDDLVKLDPADLSVLGRNTAETNRINGGGAGANDVYAGGFNDVVRKMAQSDISVVLETSPALSDIEEVVVGSDGSVVAGDRTSTIHRFLGSDLSAAGTLDVGDWGIRMSASGDGHIFVSPDSTSLPVRKVKLSDMTEVATSATNTAGGEVMFAGNGFVYSSRGGALKKLNASDLSSAVEVSASTTVNSLTVNRNIARDILGF